MFASVVDVLSNVGTFFVEEARDGVAKAWIADEVGAVSCLRQVATCYLVCSLCTSFDSGQAAFDSELDGLVVTHLKVQKWMVFDAAPVASKQSIGANKIYCSCDVASVALTEY